MNFLNIYRCESDKFFAMHKFAQINPSSIVELTKGNITIGSTVWMFRVIITDEDMHKVRGLDFQAVLVDERCYPMEQECVKEVISSLRNIK